MPGLQLSNISSLVSELQAGMDLLQAEASTLAQLAATAAGPSGPSAAPADSASGSDGDGDGATITAASHRLFLSKLNEFLAEVQQECSQLGDLQGHVVEELRRTHEYFCEMYDERQPIR